MVRLKRWKAACAVGVLTLPLVFGPGLNGDAQTKLPREWLLKTDIYGNSLHQRLTIAEKGEEVSGMLDGVPLNGRILGSQLYFTVKDKGNGLTEVAARLDGNRITGEITITSSNSPTANVKHKFSGYALEEKPPTLPETIEFEPAEFYNQFSAEIEPALTIWPGETIHTRTLDSGGMDEHGKTKALYGNPQTGPFYVGGAERGDVLAVHVKRLRLNRDYAESLDAITERAKDSGLSVQAKDLGRRVRWKLDLTNGVATLEISTEHLKNFRVPLKPMLGCIGVAPAFGFAPFSSGESGRYGGNMDFNEITEGSTVFLNVTQPGALLYIGDGHAAMGDGETTEWALETSMDVEFSVDVFKDTYIATPRVETGTHYAAIGIGGSVDEAMRRATSGMVQWMQNDYHLTTSEIALVLGSAAEYRISEVADRDAGVVLMLRKDRLRNVKNPSQ
jgi:amidase